MSIVSLLRDGPFSGIRARPRKARRVLSRSRSGDLHRARTRVAVAVVLLETRQLLSAIVTTDKQDYAPASTAFITATSDGGPGHNFQAGETVQFDITRTD